MTQTSQQAQRPQYLLDANVFIEAEKGYYAFDIAPKFWESLENHGFISTIESIDRVKDEIDRGGGALATWVNAKLAFAFKSSAQPDVIREYQRVMQWAANHSQYNQLAKNDFARLADGWLVAYCAARGHILVTHEISNPNSIKRIKIPDACIAFNVRWCNTYQMLRDLGVKF